MTCYTMIAASVFVSAVAFGGELKVDINRGTKKQTTYTETGYVNWSSDYTDTPASGTTMDTRGFTSSSGETLTIGLSQTPASASTGGLGLRTMLYQAGGDARAELVSDGVTV